MACLPWIIYFLENYRKTKNYKCIIFLIPFLVIAISSKGSVLGAFGIFFTLFYGFYLARNISKKLFLCFFVFLLLTTLIAFEDYESNGYNLLQVEHDSKYNNKAKTSFIYYVDVERLIKSPIKFNHSNSLISLTLLDTFGDYFSLFWEEDSNAFQNFRGDFIKVEVTEFIGFPKINFEDKSITLFIQNETNVYLREFISLTMSLLFYLSLIVFIKKRNAYSKFIFAPIIGILIMILQTVFSFPTPNFDPLVGDSVKPLYYSYFVCLAFIFIFIQILKTNNAIKFLLIPYFCNYVYSWISKG